MTSQQTAAGRRLPAEDMPVGQEVSCGTHDLTEEEIVDFASSWDPQYFHVDREAAAHSDYGGIIATGVHTAAIFQRLAARRLFSQYDVIAGRQIHVRFLRPARPGDTPAGSFVIRSVEPDGRGRCDVVVDGTLRNQHGAPVLSVEVHSLVRSRSAPPTRNQGSSRK